MTQIDDLVLDAWRAEHPLSRATAAGGAGLSLCARLFDGHGKNQGATAVPCEAAG